jgi:aminopeptidase Y
MVGLKRLSLIATVAAFHRSALAQLQQPLVSQPEAGRKPLVDTELLQAQISIDSLFERANALYDLAKSSEEEWGHPTRVIGSKGALIYT